MVATFNPLSDEQKSTGRTTQARDAKRNKVRQCLAMQDITRSDILAPETSPMERAALIRAWDVLEDRIRILRGKIKPGNRNVSVREEMPSRKKVAILSSMAPYLPSAQPAEPTEPLEPPTGA